MNALSRSYLQGRVPAYKKFAARWVLEEAGVREAWQQAQERKHRTLKAMRLKCCNRNATDLIDEIYSLVTSEQDDELQALFGRGPYKLAPGLFSFQVIYSTSVQH